MIQTPAEHESALRQAVDRIAARFDPNKTIVFGSRARNQGGPDSNADSLVVMAVNGSRRQQAVRIDLAPTGIPIPIDLLVVTPDDVAKHRETAGTIIHEAVREVRCHMNEPPRRMEEVALWTQKAEHDFLTAAHMMELAKQGLTDIVCYHILQAQR